MSLVSVPQQGSGAFSSGQQVTLPLVSYGFCCPDSLVISAVIRYDVANSAGAGDTTGILGGCPALAWIKDLTTTVNSSQVEYISQYNALSNMLVNAKMTPTDKLGLSKPFGLTFSTNDTLATSAPGLSNADAHIQAGGQNNTKTIRVSAPLGCIFSSASKFLPLNMGDTRITLTVEDIANFIFTRGVATVSNLQISQIQLNYDIVQFDEMVENMIMGQADGAGDIYLKTQSYAVSSVPIANAFQGQTEIPYAQSLTSIKSLFSLFTPLVGNRSFSSVDATMQNGSLQYTVAGRSLPETAISTVERPQYATLEFLAGIYGTHDPVTSARTSMSNFNWRNAGDGLDTAINTSKAYFGINCEKISSASTYFLSGISSQNSNLTVRLTTNTALGAGVNSVLIVCYDAVIKFNPTMKQVVVLK
jgi:hypothetical protein